MASNYTVIGTSDTTELSGGKIVDALQVTIQTKPSGVQLSFRRPKAQLAAEPDKGKQLIASLADQFATRAEGVMALPDVTGVLYSQNTNSVGQLDDLMTTFWQTADEQFSGNFTQTLASFGPSSDGKTPPATGDLLQAALANVGELADL